MILDVQIPARHTPIDATYCTVHEFRTVGGRRACTLFDRFLTIVLETIARGQSVLYDSDQS